jgi:ribosomal protein S12 methylthiotransferase accessory factor
MLAELTGPFGPVRPARPVRTDGWMPSICAMFNAESGNPSAITGPYRQGKRAGIGTGHAYGDPAHAATVAVSEALERYAVSVVDPRALVHASATALGADALDLGSLPQCSTRELRRPGCPIQPADPNASIRWVAGVNLHSGKDVLVPAVMVYLGLPPEPSERFWIPTSSGCAAHQTLAAAICNAICEIIERDAVAVTWLQRLPLPRLNCDYLPNPVQEIIDWCNMRGVRSHLFDATTDLDVPVVYCLQTSERPGTAAQLIGSAADFSSGRAALRAVLETMAIRPGIQARRSLPRRYLDYQSISDGASVMAQRGRRPVFAFLLREDGPLVMPRPSGPEADTERLTILLRRLAALGTAVYAVNVTPRELADVGFFVVRVVIPGLQPISPRPLAQYRAHRRLYQAPVAMGMRAQPERLLNPYPQPMA